MINNDVNYFIIVKHFTDIIMIFFELGDIFDLFYYLFILPINMSLHFEFYNMV